MDEEDTKHKSSAADDLDLDSRDPNDINSHLKVTLNIYIYFCKEL